MKKAIQLLVLLSFYSFSSFAQTSPVDAKAKGILDKLSAKTKAYTTITASFNSTLDNKKANLKVNQKGSLALKGNKYKLELDDYLIINDGVTSWTYTKETNEVQVDNADEMKNGNAIKPSDIFTIWEKGFKYKYDKEAVVGGAKCDVIKLYPTDTKSKNYHTIILAINKAKLEVQEIEVLGKGGETYTYTVTKFGPNATLTDAEFNFNKARFPGVEIIDNR